MRVCLCCESIFCSTSQTMYEGSDDGSNCDGYNSPGESMSELDLSLVGVCLTIQVAGILNLLQPWSDKVSLLD